MQYVGLGWALEAENGEDVMRHQVNFNGGCGSFIVTWPSVDQLAERPVSVPTRIGPVGAEQAVCL